jgi:GNAT superfamily N-acetyltransferase
MSKPDREPARVAVRRADRPGDLGWVVMAHGEVYQQQFGWDGDFEALVAKIVADYAAEHDPAREAGWIAEVDGARAGCVFLVSGDEPGLARLRILLVTPTARGLGVGTRLVQECLAFARDACYRRVTLWTNDVLVSARRIYEACGFVLTEEEPHHSFGHDLIGQNWALELHRSPTDQQ